MATVPKAIGLSLLLLGSIPLGIGTGVLVGSFLGRLKGAYYFVWEIPYVSAMTLLAGVFAGSLMVTVGAVLLSPGKMTGGRFLGWLLILIGASPLGFGWGMILSWTVDLFHNVHRAMISFAFRHAEGLLFPFLSLAVGLWGMTTGSVLMRGEASVKKLLGSVLVSFGSLPLGFGIFIALGWIAWWLVAPQGVPWGVLILRALLPAVLGGAMVSVGLSLLRAQRPEGAA
jgi:hypothetical protein